MKIFKTLKIAALLFGSLAAARNWQVISYSPTTPYCQEAANTTFTRIDAGFSSSTCTPYVSNEPFGNYADVVCSVDANGQIINRLDLSNDPHCGSTTYSFPTVVGTCVSTSASTSFLKFCTNDGSLDYSFYDGIQYARASVKYGSDSTCNAENATEVVLVSDASCENGSDTPSACVLQDGVYTNTYCYYTTDILFDLGFSFTNGGMMPDSPLVIEAEFSDTSCQHLSLAGLNGFIPYQSATGDCMETSPGTYSQGFCGAYGYQLYGGITESSNDTCADGQQTSSSLTPVCLANSTSSSILGCSSFTNPFIYSSLFEGAQYLAGNIVWDGRGCKGVSGSGVVGFSLAPIETCLNYTPPSNVGVWPVPGPDICFRVEPSYFMFRCDTPENLFSYMGFTIIDSNSGPTHKPTHKPTHAPTHKPTHAPTHKPTHAPTHKPTHAPTHKPTHAPTHKPTHKPTHAPTHKPTHKPTHAPTHKPTYAPRPSSSRG